MKHSLKNCSIVEDKTWPTPRIGQRAFLSVFWVPTKYLLGQHSGFKTTSPQSPRKQCLHSRGSWNASNLLDLWELVCYPSVPNIPAGKSQGKGALHCISSGWASSLIAPSGRNTDNVQIRMQEADESVQLPAQLLDSELYQDIQKGFSLWTAWLQHTMFIDGLSFCRAKGMALPAPSPCSPCAQGVTDMACGHAHSCAPARNAHPVCFTAGFLLCFPVCNRGASVKEQAHQNPLPAQNPVMSYTTKAT